LSGGIQPNDNVYHLAAQLDRYAFKAKTLLMYRTHGDAGKEKKFRAYGAGCISRNLGNGHNRNAPREEGIRHCNARFGNFTAFRP
jgi:hypothetical protein